MAGSRYTPTQRWIEMPKLSKIATDMIQNGFTKPDARNAIIFDEDNHIVSGHHRVVAAHITNTGIPEAYIKRVPNSSRVRRPWGDVELR